MDGGMEEWMDGWMDGLITGRYGWIPRAPHVPLQMAPPNSPTRPHSFLLSQKIHEKKPFSHMTLKILHVFFPVCFREQ